MASTYGIDFERKMKNYVKMRAENGDEMRAI